MSHPPHPASAPQRRDPLGFVVLSLVLLAAVPAAVLVLPNTASYVVPQAMRDLGLADRQATGFVRVCGLALPALLIALPLSATATRRMPPWTVLFGGLAMLLGAQAAAGHAASLPAIGAVRVAEGAGAGAVLPGLLAAAWERRERRTFAALLAGALTAALLLATPLVLAATPAPDPVGVAWRAILHPYWWLDAVALVGAGLLGVLWLRPAHRPVAQRGRQAERAQLLLPVAPGAGLAFLAIVTTYDWSPGAQLILAALGITGLVGLAVIGSRDAVTGSPLGYAVVMLVAGLLSMPVTGPLAGLLGGRIAPLAPFAAGAGCAALAAIPAARLRQGAARGAVLVGYGLALVAILLLLTMATTADRAALFASLCALGAGAGLAVGAALRHAGPGAGLFGLTLCFPAVLAGHLIVGPLQITKVGAVTAAGGGAAEALFALTAAYRLWLVAAGVIAVILAAVTAWTARSRVIEAEPEPPAAAAESDGAALRAG